MLRTVLKAILIAIITAAVIWVVGHLLIITKFGMAMSIGELMKQFAVFVGIIAGLWWAVNGGWSWTRGRPS